MSLTRAPYKRKRKSKKNASLHKDDANAVDTITLMMLSQENQTKTPKCLFSITQARGRKRGGLNSYHQHQGMSNSNGRDYSWGICDIRYKLEHPKIFRVHETALLKFGLVKIWLGLHKTIDNRRG
jgi:hypothetical protein